MNIQIGRSPFLRSLSEDPDDLFIMSNSFERRCLYAISTAELSGYRCRRALIVNYESSNAANHKIKELNLQKIQKYLAPILVENAVVVNTLKYDGITFYCDIRECLDFEDYRNITVDVSTFTKCTLAILLSLLHEQFPNANIRCVWTPNAHAGSLDLTKGVKETFAVPGFGGIGWLRCRVLVLFMGQEHDRTYSIWRAVDPDFVYLIASESEYSSVRRRRVFESARDITPFVDSREFNISAVDPRESQNVLLKIKEDLENRGYDGEVALACLGTKIQLIGIWNFWQETGASRLGWNYVYASPKEYISKPNEYYNELNEIDLLPNSENAASHIAA